MTHLSKSVRRDESLNPFAKGLQSILRLGIGDLKEKATEKKRTYDSNFRLLSKPVVWLNKL